MIKFLFSQAVDSCLDLVDSHYKETAVMPQLKTRIAGRQSVTKSHLGRQQRWELRKFSQKNIKGGYLMISDDNSKIIFVNSK